MAHYAFINNESIVVKVITGVNENVTQDDNGTPVGGSTEAWEQFYENQPWHQGLVCKRTSYNTYIDKNGVSQHTEGGTPFRGCYAGIGYTYDGTNEVFIPVGYTYDPDTDTFTPPPTPEPDPFE